MCRVGCLEQFLQILKQAEELDLVLNAIVKLDKLTAKVEVLADKSGVSAEKIRDLCRGRVGRPRLFAPVPSGGIRLSVKVSFIYLFFFTETKLYATIYGFGT